MKWSSRNVCCHGPVCSRLKWDILCLSQAHCLKQKRITSQSYLLYCDGGHVALITVGCLGLALCKESAEQDGSLLQRRRKGALWVRCRKNHIPSLHRKEQVHIMRYSYSVAWWEIASGYALFQNFTPACLVVLDLILGNSACTLVQWLTSMSTASAWNFM
jgi:hypothetical protein